MSAQKLTVAVAYTPTTQDRRQRHPEPQHYVDKTGARRLWGRRPTFRLGGATACPGCGRAIEDARFFLQEHTHKCRRPVATANGARECGVLVFWIAHVPAGHGAKQPQCINIGVEVTPDEVLAMRGMGLPEKLDYLDAGYGDD